MRYKLIACEVFTRELCACIARSPNTIDLEFLPKGLHDYGGDRMRQPIQALIDRADGEGYAAILLGYGMCNSGLAGIEARAIPLVIPRAHDCITVFFGGLARYESYFHANPGTYFKTTGWIERSNPTADQTQISMERALHAKLAYAELVEKYGEDNARYLVDQLGGLNHYRKVAFLEMGVEPDGSFEATAQREARERDWEYEKVAGDLSLLQRLVDGQWADNEFLLLQTGRKIVTTYDGRVIAAAEASDG